MPDPALDLSLLDGIAFACRSDCGLCCYTTPAVTPAERQRLITLDPSVPILEGEGAWSYIDGRGDGGACHFLTGSRCRAHAERPFSCREFPLSVHLGTRAQATAVLSCPGLLRPTWATSDPPRPGRTSPKGLEEELRAVREELGQRPIDRTLDRHRRDWERLEQRLGRRGRYQSPTEIEQQLRPELLEIARAGYPPGPPPPASEGIAYLPLFLEPGLGLLAIAGVEDGAELLRIDEAGASSYSAGIWPDPREPPVLDPGGERALRAYLGHLLDRDFTYWAAALRAAANADESLLELVEEDLAEFGATVLARADRRRRLRGLPDGPLDGELVWEGVRATDGEFLDRPTMGSVL
jgi:Fe-S-cluster containining protein